MFRLKRILHANKVERKIRDQEKVVRGAKKDSAPILKGYQIFRNYV
ncbi:MAG: hypothetical protein ACETV1_08515 [Candidatus Bathyarchaeia archaeon]